METLGPLKLIKAGFWVGVGFIVSSVGVCLIGICLLYAMPSLWQSTPTDSEMDSVETYMDEADKTNQIKILRFHESKHGDQLLLLGVVENAGNSSVGSIHIEAELLDEKKEMVYECSEYISRKLKGGEKENFQIKCGCGNRPVPEYSSASLRVVSASGY